MDFEEFSGLSRREINEIGTAFMERLHELIYTKPMIYTDAFAADSIWDENFAEYPLWAADYGAYEPDITRVSPTAGAVSSLLTTEEYAE